MTVFTIPCHTVFRYLFLEIKLIFTDLKRQLTGSDRRCVKDYRIVKNIHRETIRKTQLRDAAKTRQVSKPKKWKNGIILVIVGY
jgi:hypothetical protein